MSLIAKDVYVQMYVTVKYMKSEKERRKAYTQIHIGHMGNLKPYTQYNNVQRM